MKKINRLLKNEDFKKVIDKRMKVYNESFSVSYIQNSLDHVRIGVSVSKKNGNAVVRNHIKRQIRMIASSIVSKENNIDMIIVPSKNYNHLLYEDNYQNFLNLYQKIIKKEI